MAEQKSGQLQKVPIQRLEYGLPNSNSNSQLMHSMGYMLPDPHRDYQWTGGNAADRMHAELTEVEYSDSDSDSDSDEMSRWPRALKDEV